MLVGKEINADADDLMIRYICKDFFSFQIVVGDNSFHLLPRVDADGD